MQSSSMIFSDHDVTFSTVVIHIVNSVYVITELFTNAIPVRLMHLWLPEAFGIGYSIFSIMHWSVASSDPIYDMLDYNTRPRLCVFYLVLVALVICPLFHAFTVCLYYVKLSLYERIGIHKQFQKII